MSRGKKSSSLTVTSITFKASEDDPSSGDGPRWAVESGVKHTRHVRHGDSFVHIGYQSVNDQQTYQSSH